MKTSVPVEVDAANKPITSPRLVTNQRLTMVAAKHIRHAARRDARHQAPTQHQLPRRRHEQAGRMTTGSSAPVLPAPWRGFRSAASRRPRRVRSVQTGRCRSQLRKLMVARDQPKAFSHGTIKTPGVERSPAAASSARKITATTAHRVVPAEYQSLPPSQTPRRQT